jgi:short-subunit dehydrogenase
MDNTVLILGANSDIGRALAHAWAEKKANILLAARNATRLEADVSDIGIRHGVRVSAVEFDALDFDSHEAFYAGLDPQPDTVVCVFGLLTDQAEAEKDWSKARQMLDVNFTGAASILHIAANEMESRGKGTLIGISSVAGDRGRASNYYYGSAKAGFTAYLSGLRNRLASKGVHVMTVKPGFVRTSMTEGMPLPAPITADPGKVAADIVRAAGKKKNVLYTLWMWKWIMLIIRNIPERIFKGLKL